MTDAQHRNADRRTGAGGTRGDSPGLDARGHAFEQAFFRHAREADLVEQLRLRLREVAAREELSAASGITDEPILDRLAGLGVRAETLAALTLYPLIQVAWADGVMEDREREAILASAAASGLRRDGASFALLRIWTEDRPPPEMTKAFEDLVAGLRQELRPEELARLRRKLLDWARAVAEAAGDLLGNGSRISPEEEAALAALESAFSP